MLGGARFLAAMLIALSAFFAAPAAAQSAVMPALPVVAIEPGKDGPALAPFIRYTKQLGPVDVPIERMLDLPLEANAAGAQHFGPPGQRTTLALRIRNAGDAPGTWILTTGRGSLTHFRLYTLSEQGFTLVLDGSDTVIAQNNLRTYQAFSSEVTLDPGETRTVVIDFLSDNSTYMPLRLETYGTFFKDRRANIALVSGVVLAFAVLVLVNSMFFSITGYREFGWVALAQAFFAITTLHTEGYLTIFLLADSPLLSVAIEDASKSGFSLAMAQFARIFLKTSERFPRLDKTLIALIAAAAAIILLQFGLKLYSPGFRAALHAAAWVVTGSVALFLPVVGVLAIRHIGRQLWPLLVGWGSLAAFIVYGAVASMGVFAWLPINWHSVGPVGLFEVLMVTLALGLNLRKIQADREEAITRYAQSMAERLRISERAALLAEERELALSAVDNQNALLHASGHDSQQVILALNSAIEVLKRGDARVMHREVAAMLQSSVDYLSEIAATTMSGATMIGNRSNFVSLSAFKGAALIEPLLMMFKEPFAGKGLRIDADIDREATIISDRPLLMRALANLLSNSLRHTVAGGARVTLRLDGGSVGIAISDTGTGMTKAVAEQLMNGDTPRQRSREGIATGSGFRAAREIIENLGGTITIRESGPAGTTIAVRLCCAFRGVSPCSLDEFAPLLDGWRLADFDRRSEFEAALAEGASTRAVRLIAATHDDTSITRGRISETAALMLVKPLVREMAEHPSLARVSDKV
jgi:two-component system, sensor histidine kinase LadS